MTDVMNEEHTGELGEINLDWSQIMSLLGLTKQAYEIQEEDIIGKELPSIEMWRKFYHTYSKWKGFSIRVDNVRKDTNKVVYNIDGFALEKDFVDRNGWS